MFSSSSSSAATRSAPSNGLKPPQSERRAELEPTDLGPAEKLRRKMKSQPSYPKLRSLLLHVACLELGRGFYQASVVGSSVVPGGADDSLQDLHIEALTSTHFSWEIDEVREQGGTRTGAEAGSAEGRLMQQQGTARRAMPPEVTTQQLNDTQYNREPPRIQPLPTRQPDTPLGVLSSQQGPISQRSEVTQSHDHPDFHPPDGSPQQLQISDLRDAFRAHLKQKLAQARLQGALFESDKPNQPETPQPGNVQRAGGEGQEPGTVEEKRQPARQGQQRGEANITVRARSEENRIEREAQERTNKQRERTPQENRRHQAGRREQQTRGEQAGRMHTQELRPGGEEETNSLLEKEKLEREQKERERLERYMAEHLLRESQRAERTRQEHRRQERESQEQSHGEAEEAERVRQEALKQQQIEKERETNALLDSANLETEMLAIIAQKMKELQDYVLQQGRLQRGGARQDLNRSASQPEPREALEAKIEREIDHLWETFEILLRYAQRGQDLQESPSQQQGNTAAGLDVSLAPQSGEQRRIDIQEPSVQQEAGAAYQLESNDPSMNAGDPHMLNLDGRNSNINGITPSSLQGHSALSPLDNEALSDLASAVSGNFLAYYSNGDVTMSAAQEVNSRVLTGAELEALERAASSTSTTTALPGGETENVPSGVSAGYEADKEETRIADLGESLPNPDLTESVPPTTEPEPTSEGVSPTPTEFQNNNQGEPLVFLPESGATANAALSGALPESLAIEDAVSPPYLGGIRRLEELKGASSPKGNRTLGVGVQQISETNAVALLPQSFHMSSQDDTPQPRPSGTSRPFSDDETRVLQKNMDGRYFISEPSKEAPAAGAPRSHDASGNERAQINKYEAPREETQGGASSALRVLAGIRNRTKYGSSVRGDDEEFEELIFPVVELNTSSSRPPPTGPQVPWPGAMPVRRNGGSTSSSGRYQVSDGSDFPNTPYRTYMHYANPFSSPYSTHSYLENYGKRYSNRYYHEVLPQNATSWKEYVRRREEKKALEKRREEEAKEPTFGIITTEPAPTLGVLEYITRRTPLRPSQRTFTDPHRYSSPSSTLRPATRTVTDPHRYSSPSSTLRPPTRTVTDPRSYSSPSSTLRPAPITVTDPRPYSSQTMVQMGSQPDTITTTTRVSFAPYSSIAAARTAGPERF